jgi:hypothetical protein
MMGKNNGACTRLVGTRHILCAIVAGSVHNTDHAQPKIGELYVALITDEKIVRLQISVDDTLCGDKVIEGNVHRRKSNQQHTE